MMSDSPISPVNTVFSIPELADHIGLYLRPIQRRRIFLVSKTLYAAFPPTLHLYLSSFRPLLESALDSGEIQTLAPRTRSLNLDIHNDQNSPIQNRLLDTIYEHCSALETLNVEYWGESGAVLKSVLAHLPRIRNLSVKFMVGTDISVIIQTLIEARKGSSNDDGAESNHLQSLEIELKVGESKKYMSLSDFKRLLRWYPGLKSLSLIDLAFSNPSAKYPTQDDDDDDEDYEEDNVKNDGGDLEDMSKLQLSSRRRRQYAKMETLKLSKCALNEGFMLDMNTFFPKLQALEIVGCSGTWQTVLERPLPIPHKRPSASTKSFDTIPQIVYTFSELRSLVLWLEYQSGRTTLMNLARGRPHLSILKTDLLPITRTGLSELGEYCSAPQLPDPTVATKISKTVTTSTPITNKFKQLSLQTYSSPPLSPEVLEKFYGSACFRELEYIFIQASTLSIQMFPFAKTLRSLALGGGETVLSQQSEDILTDILRQLPVLEVLRIERYLTSYRVFSGLGREPEPVASESDHADVASSASNVQDWAWANEPPFLLDLEFYVRFPIEEVHLAMSDGKTLSLETLQRQVLDRFRFLERLKLHVNARHTQLALPAYTELESWRKKVQEDRGGEGSRLPVIEFVSR
ncbi:hypothetical protein BGX27_006145 [Mortierella sp. AM989]|nr:hypothetical protein BGX27_006145 [Mortierella sp. AM989]